MCDERGKERCKCSGKENSENHELKLLSESELGHVAGGTAAFYCGRCDSCTPYYMTANKGFIDSWVSLHNMNNPGHSAYYEQIDPAYV